MGAAGHSLSFPWGGHPGNEAMKPSSARPTCRPRQRTASGPDKSQQGGGALWNIRRAGTAWACLMACRRRNVALPAKCTACDAAFQRRITPPENVTDRLRRGLRAAPPGGECNIVSASGNTPLHYRAPRVVRFVHVAAFAAWCNRQPENVIRVPPVDSWLCALPSTLIRVWSLASYPAVPRLSGRAG